MIRTLHAWKIAVMALVLLVSCSQPPEIIGITDPKVPVASVAGLKEVRLFIATTRRHSDAEGVFYSAERGNKLGMGEVTVTIPPDHTPGKLERPKYLPPDPRRKFTVVDPVVYPDDADFVAALNRELAKRPPGERRIMFFVHGYNETLTDAVLRVAQFSDDSGFTGVPVLFSWASAGKLTRYVYDLNSALIARQAVVYTLGLLQGTRHDGMDLLAHSMGCFLTVEALDRAALAGQADRISKIENVMLFAPDIDIDLFANQLMTLPKKDRNFYVFTDSKDPALKLSRRIAGGVNRVGDANPQVLGEMGVTVFDLTKITDSSSGIHDTFAASPEIVQLIGKTLVEGHYQTAAAAPSMVEILEGIPVLNRLAE